MKLTMTPAGWLNNGPAIDKQEENVIRYDVTGLPSNDKVSIDATLTAEGKTWQIRRNYQSTGKTYKTAQAALDVLEAGTE